MLLPQLALLLPIPKIYIYVLIVPNCFRQCKVAATASAVPSNTEGCLISLDSSKSSQVKHNDAVVADAAVPTPIALPLLSQVPMLPQLLLSLVLAILKLFSYLSIAKMHHR